MHISDELINNYKNAKYIVHIENEVHRLYVGKPCLTIDKILAENMANCAYFITPENPFSQRLSLEENKIRHQRFVSELETFQFIYYEGYGTDENETWPRETSYLIICDDETDLRNLAGQFGQNAYLKVTRRENVSLFLLEPMKYKPID